MRALDVWATIPLVIATLNAAPTNYSDEEVVRELSRQYAKMEQSNNTRDVEAYANLLTSDFTLKPAKVIDKRQAPVVRADWLRDMSGFFQTSQPVYKTPHTINTTTVSAPNNLPSAMLSISKPSRVATTFS